MKKPSHEIMFLSKKYVHKVKERHSNWSQCFQYVNLPEIQLSFMPFSCIPCRSVVESSVLSSEHIFSEA